jgi:hypothetical protein
VLLFVGALSAFGWFIFILQFAFVMVAANIVRKRALRLDIDKHRIRLITGQGPPIAIDMGEVVDARVQLQGKSTSVDARMNNGRYLPLVRFDGDGKIWRAMFVQQSLRNVLAAPARKPKDRARRARVTDSADGEP